MGRDDPVVERVRAARREIAAECRGDLHALAEWARRIERELGDRLTRYEEAPPRPRE